MRSNGIRGTIGTSDPDYGKNPHLSAIGKGVKNKPLKVK
jgi:hypothetical protein